MIWQKRDPYWEIEANASVKRMASDLMGCTRCLVLELNWSAILSRSPFRKQPYLPDKSYRLYRGRDTQSR